MKAFKITWDLLCIASGIGIWPRFIEPRLIATTDLRLTLPALPLALKGLKIAQFSDLHFSAASSSHFLRKLTKKIEDFSPDLITFTGDFLCHSHLDDPEQLKKFLRQFHAPYGCYAILGNHDYRHYVSINSRGDYDVIDPHASTVKKGWQRLLTTTSLTGITTPAAAHVELHPGLVALLADTPFKLLHNETCVLPIKSSGLNITGLGEYSAGKCLPAPAFRDYQPEYPGIVLAHNPDSLRLLQNFPGDLILSGHTHGGQVNLPGLCHKFMLLENSSLKRGLLKVANKQIYINRGVGGVMPFRWFSLPEVLLLTLEPL
jgi:predicted MPP superfamily phosphohydrolase